MEPNQERIAHIASSTGATEQEARVLYHLGEASEAWNKLPSRKPRWPEAMRFSVHYTALVDMVLARIARRDHPEGWKPPRDAEGQDLPPQS